MVVVAAAAGRTTKFPGLQMSASAFWLRATGSPLGEYPYRTTAMGGALQQALRPFFFLDQQGGSTMKKVKITKHDKRTFLKSFLFCNE